MILANTSATRLLQASCPLGVDRAGQITIQPLHNCRQHPGSERLARVWVLSDSGLSAQYSVVPLA